MRRPRVPDKRIRGLRLAIERLRPLADNTAGTNNLFRLPTDDAHDLRTAIRYVDELALWSSEKKGQNHDDQGET